HEIIIEAALQELIGSIVAMAQLYKLENVPNEYEVTVSFDDSIAEDKKAEIDKQVLLVNAELQSKKRAIMKIFGVTEDEAMEIITEIEEEQKQAEPPMDSTVFGEGE